jgi:predicted nuclease with TOPRIM domain
MNKFYIFSFFFLLFIFFCFFKKYLDIKEPYQSCDPNAPKNYDKCGGSGGGGESGEIKASQEEIDKLEKEFSVIEEDLEGTLEMYSKNKEIIQKLKDNLENPGSKEGKEKAFDHDEHDKTTKRTTNDQINA